MASKTNQRTNIYCSNIDTFLAIFCEIKFKYNKEVTHFCKHFLKNCSMQFKNI